MAKRRVVPMRSSLPGPRPTKRDSRAGRRPGSIRGGLPHGGGGAGARVRKDTAFAAHPSAVIDAGAAIGAGTRVWHWSHVMTGARIGRGCSLGQNVFVGADVVIGDRVKIQNNVSVYEGVVLEDDVFCGPSTVFTNVVNPRSHVSRKHEYQQTLVQRGASIGANATIVCGHTIGRYAFIGAGAVVTKNVPDYALVVGNPGRVTGWMCQCGVKLASGPRAPIHARCAACGSEYLSRHRMLVRLERGRV
jgi:UDP-2-acetamido-3-amino-2,3-dideoxy-glucuronate N-acetyltransferase